MVKDNSLKPIFLVGAHRSGTTLLGLMLDSHPDLSWFHHFEWAVKYIGPNSTWPTVEKYIKFLDQDRGYQAWNLSVSSASKSYPDILNDFLSQRSKREGKYFSGATIHTRYTELHRIWPEASFIHIVRDPRDTAISTLNAGWAGNLWGGAKRWKAAEDEWNRICMLVPSEKRLLVKFEELVSDPISVLQAITNFIGIEYTEKVYSYIERTPYSYPNPKMASKWKDKISMKEAEMVELAVGDLLEKRGYTRFSKNRRASLIEKVYLNSINDWRKSKQRRSRYGWRLWTMQFLAKRLSFIKQLEWAIIRVNDMENEALENSEKYISDPNSKGA